MAVQNLIVKVQKRNRALVKFDVARIWNAIFRAAESIGGFHRDFLPGINDSIFAAHKTDESIATFLADAAIVCLNADPHHLISNFPPRIETIQDEVLHALRSYGFQHTADAVPLSGENRVIAALGLRELRKPVGAGLRALFAAAALDPAAKQLTGFDVAFRLAPRINDAGRMAEA